MVRADMPVIQEFRDLMAEYGPIGTLRKGPFKERAQLAHREKHGKKAMEDEAPDRCQKGRRYY